MESKLSANVADLSDDQRRVLESLIGQELRPNQVLYWVVANPGQEPTSDEKARARAGLTKVFEKVDHNLAENGTTGEEMRSAIDEAVQHVRSHPDE